jgi:hypothetical protein
MKTIEDTRQPEDDSPNQTINEKLCDGTILIGWGKPGHGMNGKDADLDRIGQCLVTSLETVDPIGAKEMRVDIHLRLYASVCAPSYDSIDLDTLRKNASEELKEFFKDYHGIDLDMVTEDDDESFEKIVEYFREQAESIACGANPCPDDPFAFMWDGDGAWDGGTDITLSVPLSLDEYEAIEDGDEETLGTVGQRIATEIYAGNEGGTPERDRMKHFEKEVGLWNDLINQLECYK